VGVGQRALSLSANMAGGPPPPGPREGDVTSLDSRSIAGSTATSLLRGTGGFNHPRESLNPSLHTRSLVAGALSAAAFAGGVGGMDHGAWR
jgi:hypothetical protein